MGNIDCKCIKKFKQNYNEIITTSATNENEKGNNNINRNRNVYDQNIYSTNDKFAQSRNYKIKNTLKIQDEYNNSNNNILIKGKGQNSFTPFREEEIIQNQNKNKNYININNFNSNNNNQIKSYSEENNYYNYMDFAMDFFDEINKYRCDSDLFLDLKKRFPCK
jgi:hypothetical protein